MEKSDKPVIIFDGECNLCEYSVHFIIKNDRQAKFTFTSAQSQTGKKIQSIHGVDTLKDGTVILLKNNRAYVKSDAALEIARDLDGLWGYMYILKIIPRPIRDFAYTIISKNRYRWFGKKKDCPLPDENIKKRFL